jgi:hypothetical protein
MVVTGALPQAAAHHGVGMAGMACNSWRGASCFHNISCFSSSMVGWAAICAAPAAAAAPVHFPMSRRTLDAKVWEVYTVG